MNRLVLVAICLLLAACQDKAQPVVVLISIDGLGADVQREVDTPTLDRLAARGIRARSMRPVFPTLTFPNHYSIATGLVPSEHGLVGNRFPNSIRQDWYTLYDRSKVQDGSWYRGEPLWVVAEKNGLVAASYYFVGTEAPIGGIRPTHYFDFDASVPGDARVEQVLRWLALPEPQRPSIITLYFEDVDVASHKHGPRSPEALATIHLVDAYIGELVETAGPSVHYVIVSDHGQADTSGETLILSDVISWPEDARIIEGGSYLNLFSDSLPENEALALCEKVNAAWQHGSCYTPSSAPEEWQVSDDGRYSELIFAPDAGHNIVSEASRQQQIPKGNHGWPPDADELQATFIAAGPSIRPAGDIDAISVLDVYPFVLGLLALDAPLPDPDRTALLQFLAAE